MGAGSNRLRVVAGSFSDRSAGVIALHVGWIGGDSDLLRAVFGIVRKMAGTIGDCRNFARRESLSDLSIAGGSANDRYACDSEFSGRKLGGSNPRNQRPRTVGHSAAAPYQVSKRREWFQDQHDDGSCPPTSGRPRYDHMARSVPRCATMVCGTDKHLITGPFHPFAPRRAVVYQTCGSGPGQRQEGQGRENLGL